MEPTDLTDAEVLALLCLARKMVVADGVITVAEYAYMHSLGSQVGHESYERVAGRMAEQPTSLGHALELAARVTRRDARELIVKLLTTLAGADGLDPTEQVILDSVAELWGS